MKASLNFPPSTYAFTHIHTQTQPHTPFRQFTCVSPFSVLPTLLVQVSNTNVSCTVLYLSVPVQNRSLFISNPSTQESTTQLFIQNNLLSICNMPCPVPQDHSEGCGVQSGLHGSLLLTMSEGNICLKLTIGATLENLRAESNIRNYLVLSNSHL